MIPPSSAAWPGLRLKEPCALASVKSNLGHTESAAGTVGLIKAVLALQHGTSPACCTSPSCPKTWPRSRPICLCRMMLRRGPMKRHPRRAAVSSYGMSGTNAHAILEQAPELVEHNGVAVDSAMTDRCCSRCRPLGRSAAPDCRSAGRLGGAQRARHRAAGCRVHAGASSRPRPGAHGGAGCDLPELAAALREVAEGDLPISRQSATTTAGPVWVFSGQGSQWAGMGVELLAAEPVFAATVAQIEPLIAEESGFSVTEAMTSPETVTGIDRVQPTIFAMQVALAATMKSYGVVPGGSSDTRSARSQLPSSPERCRSRTASGHLPPVRIVRPLAGGGAMASVELPAQQVLSQLADRGVNDVVVAVVASPSSTVIGGATETVRELVAGWEQREIMAREVAVDVASHSPQVDPILDELTDVLADLDPATPTIPYYSATSIDPREEPYCDADYWVENLRQMVRFAAAVQAALEDGYRVFGELSPHPLLTRAVEQTALSHEIPVAALAGMRRQQPLPHGLRDLLGDLHAAGSAVDFSVLYPTGQLVDTPLPAWSHRQLI